MQVNGYNICQGADLQGADLRDANLQDANLLGANLQCANLQGADLQDANLQDTNLQCANLQGADLQDANLQDTNLQGADLWDAYLRGVDLLGAKGIIRVGPTSDSYEFFGVLNKESVWVKAGCRWFPSDEARLHWVKTRGGTKLGEERLRFVSFIEEHFKHSL